MNDYCEVEKNEVEEDDKDIYNILKLNPEENDIGGPGYPKEWHKYTFGRELKNVYDVKNIYYMNNLHDNDVNNIY